MYYNLNDINREVKKLKIPKEYWRIPVEDALKTDYTMLLSIREDAGKTTQALLFGLVLHKLYNTTTEYLRNDKTQITRKNIETIYKTVRQFKYIEKCYDGKYNDVAYAPTLKRFYLIKRDKEGNEIDREDESLDRKSVV